MKKIKVQSRLSLTTVIISTVIIALIALGLLYAAFTQDYISIHTRHNIFGFIGFAIFMISMWMKNIKSNEAYVSELLLSDRTITLVYKWNENIRNVEVNLDEITQFAVKLNVNKVRAGKYLTQVSETEVEIKTKNGKKIEFKESPTASFASCNYSFMLRLLDHAKDLPNFSYTVEGNDFGAKADVENYAKFGKRLNCFQLYSANYKKQSTLYKIIHGFAYALIFIPLLFLLYLNLPAFNSSADKEYLSYIEDGYSFFQNNHYELALQEYDKALNIHDDDSTLYYYRALSYEYNNQYEKGMTEAQKGIDCLDKKSAYHKAKGYKFISSNDIGLYTTYGDCARYLEDYKKAIDAYSYVIDNVKYTYTDAYFKRGMCEYSLSDKRSALSDFIMHKAIVEQYIDNQEKSEHKALYPQYTLKDLDNINGWIEACK